MNYKDYKVSLTVRAMSMFEHLRNKSFFEADVEDVPYVMYCTLLANNDIVMTYKAFLELLKDEKLVRYLTNQINKINKYNEQFDCVESTADCDEPEPDDDARFVHKLASQLIVEFGLDAEYVMDKMELWELKQYADAAEEKKKQELEEKRLWTYLDLLPHVNHNKLSSPEKLLPFPWEKNKNKKKAEADLKSKEDKIKAFFARQNEKIDG